MSSSSAPRPSRIASTLIEQREAVREQLAAAWKSAVSHVVDSRFEELAARLEAALTEEVGQARRDVSGEFNRAIRRVAPAQTEQEWAAGLVDSAQLFAARVAVFSVVGERLKALDAHGIAVAGLEIPVAPAFAAAISTAEPLAAVRTPEELSPAFAVVLSSDAAAKCHLFPISASGRVVAVLYAEGDPVDSDGLEALATVVGQAPACPGKASSAPGTPDWSQLLRGEQELHMRAQRFARVRVAELRLYQSEAVLAGRNQRRLYAVLKDEIDSAREVFRRDFTSASPAMPDYLHLELIRTLANDDAGALGEDYPGPLF